MSKRSHRGRDVGAKRNSGRAPGEAPEARASIAAAGRHWRWIALLAGIGLLVGALAGGWRPRIGPSAADFDLEPLRDAPLDTLSEADRAQVESQIELIGSLQDGGVRKLAEAYGRLGELYQSYDMLNAAMPAYRNAAKLDPENPRWVYLSATVIQRQGLGEVAADFFRRAIEMEGGNLAAKVRLAEILRTAGEDENAIPLLEEILEDDPGNAMGHYLLGLIAAESGDHREAVERLEAALERQPDASSLQYPLAQSYQALGETDRAEEALARRGPGRVRIEDPVMSEVVGLRRDADAMLSRGSQLAQQGRHEEAVDAFAEAVALEPENAEAWVSMGAAHFQSNRMLEARDAFEEALRLEPENVKAMLSMGILHYREGEHDASLEIFERALTINPDDAQVRLWLGTALRRDGRCDEAVEHLDFAVELNPADETGRLNLIVCQVASRRYAEALETAERGHEISPDSALMTAALIRLLAASPEDALRDGERALELASELVERGRSIDALEVQAMALAENEEFERAAALQAEAIEAAVDRPERAAMLSWMRDNESAYASGRPIRSPWPPSVLGSDG